MPTEVKINKVIYNVLKNEDFDDFTVVQIRDLIMNSNEGYQDQNEVRKFIYRQIYALIKYEYLEKRYGACKKTAIYFKTKRFKNEKFKLGERNCFSQKKLALKKQEGIEANDIFWTALNRDKLIFEADLKIVLGEVEEYKRLVTEYPEKSGVVEPFFSDAKERSIELLGKVNALTKVVNTRC